MNRWLVISVFGLVAMSACTSEIDKQLTEIDRFYSFTKPQVTSDANQSSKITLDSLPRYADSLLMAFGKQHPKHKRSEEFVYTAIDIKLNKGMYLQAAKWANFYIDHFKSNPTHRLELAIMSAHHFEQHQVFDQALKLYKVVVNEFPKEPISEQAKQMITFIEKGITTPEEQLNYLLKQKESK